MRYTEIVLQNFQRYGHRDLILLCTLTVAQSLMDNNSKTLLINSFAETLTLISTKKSALHFQDYCKDLLVSKEIHRI